MREGQVETLRRRRELGRWREGRVGFAAEVDEAVCLGRRGAESLGVGALERAKVSLECR